VRGGIERAKLTAIRTFSADMAEATLRSLIERNDGGPKDIPD